MINTFQSNGSPEQINNAFVVRYRGRYPGFYISRTIPLFILFSVLAILYLDDEFRIMIFSRYSSRPKPFSSLEFSFLLAFMMAPLLDLGLALIRVRRGALALTFSPEGVTGPVCHMTRLLRWNEIEDVAVEGKFLVVRRKSQSLLQRLFASRGLSNINIPASHLDCPVDDILATARRLASSKPSSAASF